MIRWLVRLSFGLFVAFLGLAASRAYAGTVTTITAAPPVAQPVAGGGWQMVPDYGGAARGPGALVDWVNGNVATVGVTDAETIAARGGALAVQTTESASLTDAAVAIAGCVLARNALCAATATAGLLLNTYRAHHPKEVPGSAVPDGSLDFDPGTPTVGVTGYSGGEYSIQFSGLTAGAVCSDYAAKLNTINVVGADPHTWAVSSIVAAGSGFTCHVSNSNGNIDYAGAQATTVQQCPASVDFSNPAYDVPAGGAVGPDGLCPTARYDHVAMSPAQFGALVVAHPPAVSDHTLPQAFGQALASGQTAPGTITTTGPASQVGASTQSTSTTGTTTSTTTTTPTYNYTYAGDTINYSTSITTTVNNGGTTTTTTTTPGAPAPQDPTDPCTANPDRAGCSVLGTPPAAEAIPQQSVPVAYTPVPFAGGGSCPADLSYSIMGHAYSLSYGPLCSWVGGVAPLFEFLGACIAAIIFMEALRP